MRLNQRQQQIGYILLVAVIITLGLSINTNLAGWTLKGAILLIGLIMALSAIGPFIPKINDFLQILWRWIVNRGVDLWVLLTRKPRVTIVVAAVVIFVRVTGAIYVHSTWARTTEAENICRGVTYQREMFEGCRMHVIDVDLTQAKPIVLGVENFTYGKMRLSEIANSQLLAEVMINGDLFDEGGPQGFFSPGHRMTGPNSERVALEFVAKTNTVDVELYRFTTLAGVKVDGNHYPIRHCYNTMYTPGDIGVYTSTRGTGSGANRSNHVMQARVKLGKNYAEGMTRLWGTMTEIIDNPTSNMTPEVGEIIITAANENWQPNDIGPYAWATNTWHMDASVHIDLSMTPAPENQVISGGPEIMRFGKYLVNEPKNAWCVTQTARTAVGISADRQHLLLVIAEGQPKWGDRDLGRCPVLFGRAFGLHLLRIWPGFNGLSKGASTRTLYRFFTAKDYPHAMNLDGGSSSTLVMKREEQFKVVNSLMEDCEPSLATALGFAPR